MSLTNRNRCPTYDASNVISGVTNGNELPAYMHHRPRFQGTDTQQISPKISLVDKKWDWTTSTDAPVLASNVICGVTNEAIEIAAVAGSIFGFRLYRFQFLVCLNVSSILYFFPLVLWMPINTRDSISYAKSHFISLQLNVSGWVEAMSSSRSLPMDTRAAAGGGCTPGTKLVSSTTGLLGSPTTSDRVSRRCEKSQINDCSSGEPRNLGSGK